VGAGSEAAERLPAIEASGELHARGQRSAQVKRTGPCIKRASHSAVAVGRDVAAESEARPLVGLAMAQGNAGLAPWPVALFRRGGLQGGCNIGLVSEGFGRICRVN